VFFNSASGAALVFYLSNRNAYTPTKRRDAELMQ
jgi:hypothetical protein